MISSRIFTAIACLIIFQNAHSQLSEKFKSIDEKNSFKDILMSGTFSKIRQKMGLVQKDQSKPNRYTITDPNYLSVGVYKVKNAFVEFNGGKLSFIFFEIPYECYDVIDYFKEVFGKPKFGKMWVWEGKRLSYSIGCDVNTSHAMLIISSSVDKRILGEDNF